ncbi:hypothetical protein [Sulfurimonas sp.]|uniref:hypothetical protein n=1 Tax=Sulfurimonas sp. TaxID=2022749 RepID=UPI003567FE0C
MSKSGLTLIPYPKFVTEYFYLIGTHYVHNSNGYYRSYANNKLGLVSFDEKRCFYEKIGKKEYLEKKSEFDLALKIANVIKDKIQLTMF